MMMQLLWDMFLLIPFLCFSMVTILLVFEISEVIVQLITPGEWRHLMDEWKNVSMYVLLRIVISIALGLVALLCWRGLQL